MRLIYKLIYVLGAFAKLRKATISSVMSVRPSWSYSGPNGRTFLKFDIWVFFQSVENNQISLKSDKNNGCLMWGPIYISDHISLNSSWNEKFSGQRLYKKLKGILCSITFFSRKSRHLRNNVDKYSATEQATNDKMAHAHGMLDT